MANRSNFAEPTVSTGGKVKNFRLEQGSNQYRIGPAYASLAASGKWNHAIEQHFGYRSAPTDTAPKGFPRTFVCPRIVDRKSEIIKHNCDECVDVEALQEKVELRKQKLIAEGKSEDEIDTILKPQKAYLKEHNLDKKHLVLAKNTQGEWGVLWLPWKALEALINRRKKILAEQGVDIISTKDGVWVDFVREGEGFRNTTYACDVVTETVLVNGKKAQVMKEEPLTDADFDAIEANCPDLTTVGTRLTDDQISRLVESRGDSDIVDAIFNEAWEAKKGNKREASASPVKPAAKPMKRREYDEDLSDEDVIAQGRAANGAGDGPIDIPEKAIFKDEGVSKKVEKKVEVKTEEVDEEATLMAQLEAMRARKKAAAAKATPAEVAQVIKPKVEVSPDADPDQLPDDQFLEVYGPKKK